MHTECTVCECTQRTCFWIQDFGVGVKTAVKILMASLLLNKS